MKCQYCGSEIPDDAVFCPECGQRQEDHSTDIDYPAGLNEGSQQELEEQLNQEPEQKSGEGFEQGPDQEPEQKSGEGFEQEPDQEMEQKLEQELQRELQKVLEQEPEKESTKKACPVCGTVLGDGDLFCPECGAQISPSRMPVKEVPPVKKKGKTPIIVAGVIGGILLIAVVAVVLVLVFRREDEAPSIDSIEQEIVEPSDEDVLSDADFNLLDEDELYFEGFVKKTENGDYILRLDEEYTFYGEDFYGDNILLENVRNIHIDQSVLPEKMLDSIKSNQTVEVDGQLYIDNETLYISPFFIWDEDGEDLIETFEKSQSEDELLNKDYILPQSGSRLLTESDVAGMDIREINYAKNEMYARHGRMFQSAELQNYFNSKSWYYGTVSPEDFDNSMLSEVERKNADFLSQIEFGMDPKGYQLDAQ